MEFKKPELLTRGEAAEYLGLNVGTLAVWASTGRYGLRFRKIGRLVRYDRRDLDAFLERRARTATQDSEPANIDIDAPALRG